ncbi:response regulator [Cellulomonas sp. JZ18]|uniref:LytR/AlgR family response regulator transcription factor n=1 Tax=Cellulomonas sp. JZ18 TaxID=2654191 RepID=UPI0012D48FF1|nr:LytTR family DNA-binding domain-containing protein [Cellulomonas sp. JZ18]QGQ18974.1 response regulator [Cellulomonas sp. JZ18]
MIRVGIAEDDAASVALLRSYLDRYEQEHDVAFRTTTYGDGADLVERYRSDQDILLLDVEMPDLDGFSAAERVRAVDQDVVIVFITNMAQYAIRGYEVEALSYLLKPVPYYAFSQQMRRSVERVRARASVDRLSFTVNGDLVRLDLADVLYVESIRHHLVVHTVDGRYQLVGALKNMEAELADKGFFRSNNCYLVNMRHVRAVRQSTCVLHGGHELVVSRPRKKAFLAALTDHVGGRHA